MIAYGLDKSPGRTTMINTLPRTQASDRGAPGAVIRPLIALVADWGERRRQRRALLELGDHLLKDIGIGRADAWAEGSKPFWRS